MTNLIHFQSTIHGTVYIDTDTNRGYWTASSFAAFSGINKSSINNAIRRGSISAEITVEIPTVSGLQKGSIFPAEDPGALKLLMKHNPEAALKLMQAGANEYIHHISGFTITSSVNNQPINEHLWTEPRDEHSRNFRAWALMPSQLNKLHRILFGVEIAQDIKRKPLMEFLEEETNVIPDHLDVNELWYLVDARRALATAIRRPSLGEPYTYAKKKADEIAAKRKKSSAV